MGKTRWFAATLFKHIVSGGEDDDQSPGWSCTECSWSATDASVTDDISPAEAAERHAQEYHEETPAEKGISTTRQPGWGDG